MTYYQILQAPSNIFRQFHIVDENTEIDLDNYCRVYKDKIDLSNLPNVSVFEILHNIFMRFNLYHPAHYAGHSLSAGDIVQLNSDYWLCASGGWIKLNRGEY